MPKDDAITLLIESDDDLVLSSHNLAVDILFKIILTRTGEPRVKQCRPTTVT